MRPYNFPFLNLSIVRKIPQIRPTGYFVINFRMPFSAVSEVSLSTMLLMLLLQLRIISFCVTNVVSVVSVRTSPLAPLQFAEYSLERGTRHLAKLAAISAMAKVVISPTGGYALNSFQLTVKCGTSGETCTGILCALCIVVVKLRRRPLSPAHIGYLRRLIPPKARSNRAREQRQLLLRTA